MRHEKTPTAREQTHHNRRWVRRNGSPYPPEILEFGYDNPSQALTLPMHAHVEAFEFVVIEKGHAAWEVDGELFHTRAGDVFHTRPGEVHRGGYEVIEPCRFWWMQVSTGIAANTGDLSGRNWMDLPSEESASLMEALSTLPRVFHGGSWMADPLKRLRDLADRGDIFAKVESRAAVLDFLVGLLRPRLHKQVPRDVQTGLEEIIQRMHTTPDWHPRIDELAASLKVSVSHFHRTFRDYTGLSPMEYLVRLRMEEACHRLETTNDSITQISFDLGYATTQHFATVFRRTMGQPPSHWRKK